MRATFYISSLRGPRRECCSRHDGDVGRGLGCDKDHMILEIVQNHHGAWVDGRNERTERTAGSRRPYPVCRRYAVAFFSAICKTVGIRAFSDFHVCALCLLQTTLFVRRESMMQAFVSALLIVLNTNSNVIAAINVNDVPHCPTSVATRRHTGCGSSEFVTNKGATHQKKTENALPFCR